MVGNWIAEQQCIRVTTPANVKHVVALMLFSPGCEKWFEISDGGSSTAPLVFGNCVAGGHAYQVLPSGHVFEIRAKCRENECLEPDLEEKIVQAIDSFGHSDYGDRDIITYHEFHVNVSGKPTEVLGITLIIVDDIVGPHA